MIKIAHYLLLVFYFKLYRWILPANRKYSYHDWYLVWTKRNSKNKTNAELLSLGFSTFFLNRTNRSGIIKGGVIGGLNQTGNYLIDARYNSDDLKKRIKLIALYKDKIELHNLDAVELIHNLQSNLPNNSLFYFDPPYYKKVRVSIWIIMMTKTIEIL